MRPIKEFLCDKTFPTKEEIKECVEMANTEDCVIKLKWFFYGWYELRVFKGMTLEECEAKLPEEYPV